MIFLVNLFVHSASLIDEIVYKSIRLVYLIFSLENDIG